jgi:hypothetical protein
MIFNTKYTNQLPVELVNIIADFRDYDKYCLPKHKNLLKRFGTLIESILLMLFKNLNFNQTKFICFLISPLIIISLVLYNIHPYKYSVFLMLDKNSIITIYCFRKSVRSLSIISGLLISNFIYSKINLIN